MKKRIAINTIFGVFARGIYIVITLVLNKIFIESMGLDYLGLNATFNEAMGILSFAELGIGVAISYELYQPLKNKEYDRVNKLVTLYRKIYQCIALIVLIIGIGMAFGISATVKTTIYQKEVFICFILFVINNAFSYLIANKRTLIEACQDGFILNIVDTLNQFAFTVIKCIILFLFKNYYAFLFVSIIQSLITAFCIDCVSRRKYVWLNSKSGQLNKLEVKELFKVIGARVVIKFSNVAVTSTDNLIISSLISVSTVGLFYNYKVIFSNVIILASQFFAALTPAFGMRLNDKNISVERKLSYVKESEFISTLISLFCGVCLIELSSPFISWIYGPQYVMDKWTIVLFALSFYIDINREIHWKVNHICTGYPKRRLQMYIIRAFSNLFISIILCFRCGLNGVIIGTIVSGVIIWWYESWLMYKEVFKIKYFPYIIRQVKGLLVFVGTVVISDICVKQVVWKSDFAEFVCSALIIGCICVFVIMILYFNDMRQMIKYLFGKSKSK